MIRRTEEPRRGAAADAAARLWPGQPAQGQGYGATCRTCAIPAVLLIDQLKEVYIDGELETVDTTIYLPKLLKRDFNRRIGPRWQWLRSGSEPLHGLQLWG